MRPVQATPVMSRDESTRIYAELSETTPASPEKARMLAEADALYLRVSRRATHEAKL